MNPVNKNVLINSKNKKDIFTHKKYFPQTKYKPFIPEAFLQNINNFLRNN